jgi:hypothetical protein
MLSQYDTPDTNNTQDLFDIGNDFNDTLDNTQQQSQQTSTSSISLQSTVPSSSSPILNQQSTNIYQQQQQTQPRLTYVPQTRAQLSSYQTPNLQRIQTMPPTPTIVRPANVISNGIQQQPTIYTQQQMINSSSGLNRPLYQRMPTGTQQSNMPSTLVRQQYNTTGMINMNQNVPQMSIVKASDPNNNNVFVTNPQQQQQQQPTLLGLQQTVTQPPTVQSNKSLPTVLPSLTPQQLNQFQVQQQQIHMQQQNTVQSYNTASMRTQMMDQAPTNYIVTSQQQSQQQQQQQQQTNHMLVQQTQQPPQQGTNNPQQHTEVQRKQFIQKQLVLLLHAHKCQQREKQTINGETTRPNTCTLPHCSTMKTVLQHMTKCNDHKTCPVAHCVTSRQIILHWKQCNNSQCPICQPLKTPSTLAKLTQGTTTNTTGISSTNPNINIPSTSNPNAMNERPITKEWQRRVTSEMCNHLVQKIITALIPITDTGAVRDKRIINLANYARRVENETFEIANNQEEYFHKLAEKIYKIQKELEDRREKKSLQDMQ